MTHIHHFGQATSNIEKAISFYKNVGYEFSKIIYDPNQKVNLTISNNAISPKIELISSDDENSPVFNILKKWGPNFYHCCYLINFKKDNIHDVFKGLNMKMLLKPTPAILFGNRKISFYIVEGVGLVEFLEA